MCAHQDIPVVEDLGGLHQCNLPQTRPSLLVHIKQVWQHNLQRIFSADEVCTHGNTLQNHCNGSADTKLSGAAAVLCFVIERTCKQCKPCRAPSKQDIESLHPNHLLCYCCSISSKVQYCIHTTYDMILAYQGAYLRPTPE
jgi:hypothetical protein